MQRLAIITTHPIQYNAPMFKMLAEQPQIELKVFYTWSQAKEKVKDKTFGREIEWDIPLLEGYKFEFVENISKNPGSSHWRGIQNPQLIQKIQHFEPDAILVYGWNLSSHFKVLRYFNGKIPLWFRGDSTLINESIGIKTVLRRLWLTYVYSHVDIGFYVGKENKKYFLAHGLKEKQLVFAPHAIDNNRFFDSDEKQYEFQAAEWRNGLGFAQEDLVVLFAGKFEQNKNPLLLINVVQEINGKRERPIKLLMLGGGPMEQEIKKQISGDKNIKMLPFQNQSRMPVVYRLGDILCLPSKSETWGLAINEAMACERPVVVSDKVGCATDLVIQEENGFIFKSESKSELERILYSLSPRECKRMGIEARKNIVPWSFENIVAPLTRQILSI